MKNYKNTSTAFILWFFLGAHYFYLGKIGMQILFYVTFGGFGIWALIDLFRIKGMVRAYNQML